MTTPTIDRALVGAAVALATSAPSVHNTQPWRWSFDGRTVQLRADRLYWLPATDPEGRDLLLSCGAALHHLRVALAAEGVATEVQRFPDPADPDYLATVRLSPGRALEGQLDLVSAIRRRRSDRRSFGTGRVPDHVLATVAAAAEGQGAVFRMVGAAQRAAVADAVIEAARIQEASPAYVRELDRWTSGRFVADDAVPAANLPRPGEPDIEVQRRFAGTAHEPADPGPPDGSVLALLATPSDDPASRLLAGEALSAALLMATALGVATCPVSQPIEVTSTRLRIREQVLGGTAEPQVLVRLGWAPTGPPLPATRRRPLPAVTDPHPLVRRAAAGR